MTNATPAKNPAPHFVISGLPNTPEGRAAIALLKKHTNHARYALRVRSNGPRVEAAKSDGLYPGAYHQSLPQKHAQTFRVYVTDTEQQKEMRRLQMDAYREKGNFEAAKRNAEEAHHVCATLRASLITAEECAEAARDRLNREAVAHDRTKDALQIAGQSLEMMQAQCRRAESRALATQKQLNAIPAPVLYLCGLWADVVAAVRGFIADMKADR